MITNNQLIRKVRKKKFRTQKNAALMKNPFKRGVVLKLVIRTPKKPNSAMRKVAYLRLSTQRRVYATIPGEKHNLQDHSVVLVRGGRARDVPGLKYKLVRGVYDFSGQEGRKKRRSKYGVPKN